MAPRKLSDSDKGTIVELYKQPGQTTSTLAEQYGVSSSTISRILKMSIPSEDYRALVSQKRMGGSADRASAKSSAKSSAESSADKAAAPKGRKRRSRADTTAEQAKPQSDPSKSDSANSEPATDEAERTSVAPPKLKTTAEKEDAKAKSSTRRRRRSCADAAADEQLPLLAAEDETPIPPSSVPPSVDDEVEDDDDDDDLTGLDETLGDDFGDDDDDLDDDLDDDDEGSEETPKPKLQLKNTMQVMPLGEAVMPKPCYLVIDMRSELITRPLIEFADLGQVPSEEERAKTLPVFDNHRVARRFSRNKQRVIKVPDGSLITRTRPYLAAKGITRLLVDGQVFDLAGVED